MLILVFLGILSMAVASYLTGYTIENYSKEMITPILITLSAGIILFISGWLPLVSDLRFSITIFLVVFCYNYVAGLLGILVASGEKE